MPWPPKSWQVANYTEEPVCIVSKEDLCVVWAGAKSLFSGNHVSGGPGAGASGYNYASGEVDVEPINDSGWGHIKVPELSEVHFALVTPKRPCIQAAVDYLGNSGNVKSGIGGISGNTMLVHYCDTCLTATTSGVSPIYSGAICWHSGTSFISGIVDVVAFGSRY